MTTYSYNLTDILSGKLNSDLLVTKIKASAITIALDRIDTTGDSIGIVFKAELTASEITALNGLVTNHSGEPTNINLTVDIGNDLIIKESPPFATPSFRTKRNSSAIVDVAKNTSGIVDYYLTQERYAQGGQLIYRNAELGDYISAEIHDKDSIIPEAYRAALCENWPTVATYIEKQLIDDVKSSQTIDTYPLNAKITAGLYLRVTYNAIDFGETRKVAVNYFLSKKL